VVCDANANPTLKRGANKRGAYGARIWRKDMVWEIIRPEMR